MQKNWLMKLVLVLMLNLVLAVSAYAEINTSAGITFRLRHETWDDLTDFKATDDIHGTAPREYPASDDTNFWRLKTTPWLKVDMNKQYTGYVRLANEARYYMDSTNAGNQLGSNKDELLFDNLYVKAVGLGGVVDVTVGRQDFLGVFGEGFLIMDGTPLDGSRTFYFDAVRALVKLGDSWNVDFVYLSNHSKDDRLPVAHSVSQRSLNASDEQAAIVYGRGKLGSLTLEPYYIWKKERTADELDLNTVGARAVLGFGGGWKLRGEAAMQTGDYDSGVDHESIGGYVYIGRKYENVTLKPAFDLGYILLSGDDPNTTKEEGWNPLFSRYPWISELYSLSYAGETGIPAYWTNLKALRAVVKLDLPNKSGLDLSYTVMQADQTVTGPIFGTGKDRGELMTVKLSHTFSPSTTGYVTVEEFMPGDYYAETNRDNATFVRWEIQWKI